MKIKIVYAHKAVFDAFQQVFPLNLPLGKYPTPNPSPQGAGSLLAWNGGKNKSLPEGRLVTIYSPPYREGLGVGLFFPIFYSSTQPVSLAFHSGTTFPGW